MLKGKKKQHIVNVSIDLFAAHGIDSVSLARIASESGISRPNVYYHFKKGKDDIVAAILQIFESCVSESTPNREEWESKESDAQQILLGWLTQFPADNTLRLRKITRIIMAEMYHNKQVARHAVSALITGRERTLAECFTELASSGKIAPLNAESTARYFNRYLVVCAMEDALCYPYSGESESEETATLQEQVLRDCESFIGIILRTT